MSVEYDELPHVVDPGRALNGDAPRLCEGALDNVVAQTRYGDPERCDAAFARAAHVTRLVVRNQRVAAVSVEQRSVLAWVAEDGRLTVRLANQKPSGVRNELADHILRIGLRMTREPRGTDPLGRACGELCSDDRFGPEEILQVVAGEAVDDEAAARHEAHGGFALQQQQALAARGELQDPFRFPRGLARPFAGLSSEPTSKGRIMRSSPTRRRPARRLRSGRRPPAKRGRSPRLPCHRPR